MIGKKPSFMSSEYYYWDETLNRWTLYKNAPESLWKEFLEFEILMRTKGKSIDEVSIIIDSIREEINEMRNTNNK